MDQRKHTGNNFKTFLKLTIWSKMFSKFVFNLLKIICSTDLDNNFDRNRPYGSSSVKHLNIIEYSDNYISFSTFGGSGNEF